MSRPVLRIGLEFLEFASRKKQTLSCISDQCREFVLLCIWPPTHTTCYNNLNRWPAHHKAGTIQGDMEPGASKSPEDLSPMVLQSTSRDIENIQMHGCHDCIVVFQFIPEPLFKNWVGSGIQMCAQLPPNMSKNIKNQLHPSNTSGSFLVVQYNSKLPRAA